MLKHGILGLLNYGDKTGYEIMETFRDSLNFFWAANTSQIYRELQTLKKKGYVTDELIKQTSRPDKKVFSITKEGHEELRDWLKKYDFGNNNSPICMKTFFSGELSVSENIERFLAIKAECSETLKQYAGVDKIMEGYQEKVSNKATAIYWKMTLDYGIRYGKMLLEWCEACIQELEAIK